MHKRAIVAAGHSCTADAAADILAAGGTVADAALGGWLVSCLSEPVLTSPGGGGFAMVGPASGPVQLFDFFTQTPIRRHPDGAAYPLEADFGSTRQVFHLGAGSMATPGCVAGLLELHSRFGRMPLQDLVVPARQLAKKGVPIDAHAARLLKVVADLYLCTPESRQLFASKSGASGCLQEGEQFTHPAFVDFLDHLVDEGARGFYEGETGARVAAYAAANGGHLQREDFESYRVAVREPLEVAHAGSRIWLNPPPSMGGCLIGIGLFGSPAMVKQAFPFSHKADWEAWNAPLRLMARIRRNIDFPESHDSALMEAMAERAPALKAAWEVLFPDSLVHLRERGTTQLSVIDDEGNALSLTTSNGSGSAVIVQGTGFMMNNMLGEEDLMPEGPESWRCNERLSSMMAPTLAELPNGSRVVTGSGGSNRIRSVLLQVLRHLTEREAALEEAISAPRLHWEGDVLHAETDAVGAILEATGQQPVSHELPNLFFGGAHSVAVSDNGRLHGCPDPRRGGSLRMVP